MKTPFHVLSLLFPLSLVLPMAAEAQIRTSLCSNAELEISANLDGSDENGLMDLTVYNEAKYIGRFSLVYQNDGPGEGHFEPEYLVVDSSGRSVARLSASFKGGGLHVPSLIDLSGDGTTGKIFGSRPDEQEEMLLIDLTNGKTTLTCH